MTDPTPAEELRAAADKLRRLFDNLGTEGLAAWLPASRATSPDLFSVKTVGAPGGDFLVASGMFQSTAAYIAAMHPAVGYALADWLESTAATIEAVIRKHEDAATESSHWVAPALAVARAINGGP